MQVSLQSKRRVRPAGGGLQKKELEKKKKKKLDSETSSE
jgi:hypothetical protein